MDKTVEVSQAARDAAEEAGSAANVVSHGGYYEIDIDKVAQVFARFEATTRATQPEAALREALEGLAVLQERAEHPKEPTGWKVHDSHFFNWLSENMCPENVAYLKACVWLAKGDASLTIAALKDHRHG